LLRRTDSNNPHDWLFFAASDMEGIQTLAAKQMSYWMCQSKLAEALEKILKAELIRLGWLLEKTHDLQRLGGELQARGSDLAATVRPLCNALAEVYFSHRYPGFDLEEENWPELDGWVAQIAVLLTTVQGRLPPVVSE